MLVVISDLHMEAESAYALPGVGEHPPLIIRRNISPVAYRRVFASLAYEARQNRAKALHLVLAGDIFEINRSVLWFHDNPHQLRPYVSNREVSPALEARVLTILSHVASEPDVAAALTAIKRLVNGLYLNGKHEESFPVPVHVHYIPGNHDRLANATPAIRRKVRELLGMPQTSEPFHHAIFFPEERALVRHGHEYDQYNFSLDHHQWEEIPRHLPEVAYDRPAFGDFVSVDIAAQIPELMRRHYGDAGIVSSQLLRDLYSRSIAFDDLRPRSAVLPYLLQMPSPDLRREDLWDLVEHLLEELLETIHEDPFLLHSLEQMDEQWQLDVVDVIQAGLELRAWRWAGIPLTLAEKVSNQAMQRSGVEELAEHVAAREVMIKSGEALFLVAGHTHRPRVALLAHDHHGERYYIDTGTWRGRVTANDPYFTAFGQLKTLTYAALYGPQEDLGDRKPGMKIASVDAWTGFSQRW